MTPGHVDSSGADATRPATTVIDPLESRAAARAKAKASMEELYEEDADAAKKVDAPMDVDPIVASAKAAQLDADMSSASLKAKISSTVDAMVPEAELLITHVTTKEFDLSSKTPQEFEDLVEALKNAIARVEAEKQKAVEEVAKKCSEVARAAMADVQKTFNGQAGAVAALRKKIAELRGKLQKSMQDGCKTTKMDKLRGKLHAAAGEEGIEPDTIRNIKYLKDNTHASNGGDINLGTKVFEEKAAKPTLGDEVIKKTEDSANFKKIFKCFTEKVSTDGAGKVSNSASFNNPSLLRAARAAIKGAEASGGHEYNINYFDILEGGSTLNPQPHGLPHLHIVRYGAIAVAGAQCDAEKPVAQQIVDLMGLSGEDFAKTVTSEPNLFAAVKKGEVLYMPPGVIACARAAENTTGLRWATINQKNKDELKKVQMVVAALCESYPTLRGSQHGSRLKYLSRRARRRARATPVRAVAHRRCDGRFADSSAEVSGPALLPGACPRWSAGQRARSGRFSMTGEADSQGPWV
ncbi:unnamed protein product [Prorocentrum cordatum]|uniref:Uncharacterized protein n=1 Tax=Prorocentrum cordatum TaxID=2364126 RepID=A0ABN9WDG5_9DINO|nr:unnamed protein product [Polarella glacialis]